MPTVANFTTLELVAGQAGVVGSADGTGAGATFDGLLGIVNDGVGNLYSVDYSDQLVRQIALDGGVVTTLVSSELFSDQDENIVYDGMGNLYVAAAGYQEIDQVVISTGVVTTVTGKPFTCGDANGDAGTFCYPYGITLDGQGNLYVTDGQNDLIREVVLATGVVSTIAGQDHVPGSADGTSTQATFNVPDTIVYDGVGNLFIGDANNYTIRQLVVATGEVTTLAGMPGTKGSADGTGSAATFGSVGDMVYDGIGDLYVADVDNGTIRKVVVGAGGEGAGVVTTVIGVAGSLSYTLGAIPGTARLNHPFGLALGACGTELFITDNVENVILVAR